MDTQKIQGLVSIAEVVVRIRYSLECNGKCKTEVNGLSCGLVRVLYTRTGTNTSMCELAERQEQSYNYNNTIFTQW